jgi:membrane protein
MNLSRIPWKSSWLALCERFKTCQLPLTASSLTFTTIIALVPLLTVALAVFTAFPMFSTLQTILQKWLVESLVPDNISRQVLSYLTQFSGKASKLGLLGVAVLLVTALALILTIDRTLNRIWRVPKARPLQQRVLIYWAVLTLGPLLLAASLAITSFVISSGNGMVGGLPGGVRWLFDLLEFALIAAGFAALFRFVPNTHVPWPHAWVGGLFAAAGIGLAKKGLTLYLSAMPTYSAVYGAFAVVPILLIWIYLAWLIVLTGAVLAAWMPALWQGEVRKPTEHGWQFQLALEVLQHLAQASPGTAAPGAAGATKTQLARSMQVELAQLEPALHTLLQLGWIGQLDESSTDTEPRLLLLVNLDQTRLAPLAQALLLQRTPLTEVIWRDGLEGAAGLRTAV